MSTIQLKEQHQKILKIDASIDRLVKRIELLNYINPLNIASEKKKFFASKYNYEPSFNYPKIKFDGYQLHRLLFSHRLEDIKSEPIRQLYEDVIYEYSGLIECIDTIGKGRKFYYNSLKSFGTPTEIDLENAKFILRFQENQHSEDMVPKYDVNEAIAYFEDFSKRYDFKYNIKVSSNLSAAAMVLNNIKTLVLHKHHIYSKNQLEVLTNHEIGVHMVTTFNALEQPLKIFSNGFPNNVQTQEGLAVYSEFMSGCLTVSRLRELAFRVIAVDSLNKGYNFSATFNLLHSQYKLDRQKAFGITQRVHRGGGFTKDHLYLSGLRDICDFALKNNDLNLLLSGKVALNYLNTIKSLIEMGLAKEPKFITDAYYKDHQKDDTVKLILKGLR